MIHLSIYVVCFISDIVLISYTVDVPTGATLLPPDVDIVTKGMLLFYFPPLYLRPFGKMLIYLMRL